MSSSEDIVEIITPTKKKGKKKQKKKQKTNNDSIQIIDEIPRPNCDTSIEIISEHLGKSTKSPVVLTLEGPATNSGGTNSLSSPEETKDNVDSSSFSTNTSSKNTPDCTTVSSQSKKTTTQSMEEISVHPDTSSKNPSSPMEDSQPEEDLSHLFQIDRAPDSEGRTIVPKYVSKFSEAALSEDVVVKKKSWRQPAMCFNCNGEHSMRDCTKPRNQGNINRNRNIFLANKAKQTGNVSASRYHLDHHQKFAHIKPGKISRRLRKALKLSHDQLPLHIYRMRLVGYPPAWLEEAKVNHSGITVFDSSGQALADPDDEDGEVEVDRCKYDMKKLIEFPGFNVRPPKGTLNESDYLGFPDMLPEQNKDRMISQLTPRAALPYKKRKLETKDLPTPGSDEEDLNHTGASIRNSTDMDVDDVPETRFEPAGGCAFIPSLPDDPAPPPPPPPPPASSPTPPPPGEEEEEEEGEIKSDEEEEKKEEADGKGKKRKREETEDGDVSRKKRKSVPESTPGSSSSHAAPAPPPSSPSSSPLVKSPSSFSLGSIKAVDLGTPIIQHASSTERLPSHEAFSKNICDVINFDNLPDSTGKYKILSKVVKRVRNFMTKLTAKNS